MWDEYQLICLIFLPADIYGDTPRDEGKSFSKIERLAQSLHAIFVCLGFLAATYTTIVFTLFGLYAKTALGTGDDAAYLELLKATSDIRLRGFQAFLVCLVSFNVSVMMNMFLNNHGKIRWIIATMGALGTGISLFHFKYIINMATKIIFH